MLGPILTSCLFPVHRPGEIENSQKLPMGRNFFFFFAISLSKKLYDKKVLKDKQLIQ